MRELEGQLKRAEKNIVVRSCGTQAEEQVAQPAQPAMTLKLPSAPGMKSSAIHFGYIITSILVLVQLY